MLGPGAAFRDGQREAIQAVAQDGERALVVQRTGWGKSLVYWIAMRVRRDEGNGPTLIVSPLLSLMRNQIAMADLDLIAKGGVSLPADALEIDPVTVDSLLAFVPVGARQVAEDPKPYEQQALFDD